MPSIAVRGQPQPVEQRLLGARRPGGLDVGGVGGEHPVGWRRARRRPRRAAPHPSARWSAAPGPAKRCGLGGPLRARLHGYRRVSDGRRGGSHSSHEYSIIYRRRRRSCTTGNDLHPRADMSTHRSRPIRGRSHCSECVVRAPHLARRHHPQPGLDGTDVPVLGRRDGPESECRTTGTSTHLVRRAIGGAGLILTEATAVSPEGRISPADLGIWNDTQAEAFRRINALLAYLGAVPGHPARARRPQGLDRSAPWRGGGRRSPTTDGGWQTVAPERRSVRRRLRRAARADRRRHRRRSSRDFADAAAARARRPGSRSSRSTAPTATCSHQFLSPAQQPAAPTRYGGSFENRTRLAARGRRRGPRGVAGRAAALRPHLGHRLAARSAAGRRRGRGRRVAWRMLTRRTASTSSTSPPAATRRRRDPGRTRATRCRSPRASRPRPRCPTAAVGLITEPEQAERIVGDGRPTPSSSAANCCAIPTGHGARPVTECRGTPQFPSQYARAY